MHPWLSLSSRAFVAVFLISAVSGAARASQESDRISQLILNNQLLRVSGNVFESSALQAIYAPVSYEPLWVRDGQRSPLGEAMKSILQSAERHGLRSSDYWTPLIENVSRDLKANTWISFEIAMTDSVIRYARDLSVGRVDPEIVDDDVKFTRRAFDLAAVSQALAQDPSQVPAAFDAFAPKHDLYSRLMKTLASLRGAKVPAVKTPEKDLKTGDSHPSLVALKAKLAVLGYSISDATPEFTPELEAAVLKYQDDNGLPRGSKLLAKGTFWRHATVPLEDRVRQIEASMEKLRWLPPQLENRHVWVNLAFQTFRLFENGQVKLAMKTVNGRPVRRTPMMRDQIVSVEFNPTWTVPLSIALKDKVPQIVRNVGFLDEHNLKVYEADTFNEVDPYSIDWTRVGKTNFPYYLKQGPGLDNALGTMKFHLTNPYAIYFHDTNERNLFQESSRQRSSGCIRLEKPTLLASDLLQNNRDWPLSRINAVYAGDMTATSGRTEVAVRPNAPLPVYLMYLTAEVDTAGALRFVDDTYGQDQRLSRAISAPVRTFPGAAPAAGDGQLVVNGTAGPTQFMAKVLAIRCDQDRKGACDQPQSFDLNRPVQLPAGMYIVGFENSLYPGWVEVQVGRRTRLDLVRMELPSALRAEKNVKVFRDLTNALEQRKLMWAYSQLGKHPFALATYDFGDLAVSAANRRDLIGRINDDACARLTSYEEPTEEARDACNVLKDAFTDAGGLNALFKFQSDSSVIQSWVANPGDRLQIRLKRHLVAAPLDGGDFVSVFPGAYRAIAEKAKSSIPFTAGTLGWSGDEARWRVRPRSTSLSVDGVTDDLGARPNDDFFGSTRDRLRRVSPF